MWQKLHQINQVVLFLQKLQQINQVGPIVTEAPSD